MKNIKLYRTTSLVDDVKKDIYYLHLIKKKNMLHVLKFLQPTMNLTWFLLKLSTF